MQIIGIDHVVVATEDLEETTALFGSLLDLDFGETFVSENLESRLSTDAAKLDVVSPKDPSDDSPVSRHLRENGPGLAGLVFRVTDVESARTELAEKGVEPVRKVSGNNYHEYYYHPQDFVGIFLGIVEFRHPAETNLKIEREITNF